MKKIQADYLMILYFKDLYLYLAKNKMPSTKKAIQKGGNISRKIDTARFIIVQTDMYTQKGNSNVGDT